MSTQAKLRRTGISRGVVVILALLWLAANVAAHANSGWRYALTESQFGASVQSNG